MKKLPLEIIEWIFSLACVDDGTTGRYLAETCRLFRIAVEPYQWNSLAFRSLDTLRNFIGTMKPILCRRPSESEYRRTIRHLFLVIDYNPSILPSSTQDTPDMLIEDLFTTLLKFVQHSLVSLTCYNAEPFSVLETNVVRSLASVISELSFPKLQELTASPLIFHNIPSLRGDHNSPARKLNISRLHIYDWQPAYTRRLFQHLILNFPYASHLRISGRTGLPHLFWTMLQDELEALWNSSRKKHPNATGDKQDVIPLTLKHVLYQSDAAISSLDIADIQQKFNKLISNYSRNLHLFTVLPSGRYEIDDMYRDWLNCLEKGYECWEVEEDEFEREYAGDSGSPPSVSSKQ